MAFRINKTTAALAVILLMGIAAFIIYIQSSDNNTKDNSPKAAQSSAADEVMSPSDLSKQHDDYVNKPVTVKGLIAKNGETYTIVDAEGKIRNSFIIDTSKIDKQQLEQYLAGQPITTKSYTVKGTFHQDVNATTGAVSNVALIANSVSE